MGLNTPWFLRPAVARLAALVLAVALALPGAASGLAAPADQALVCPPGGPSAGEAPRRLAFELDFGAGSPYAQRYGEQFRALDYARRAAVTAEVLDYIVDVALRLAGATTLARGYGPGGYEQVVSPSGQVELCGSADLAEQVMRIIGYLAQQTEVYGSRPDPTGPNSAVDIYQMNGSDLGDPDVAAELFQRLGGLEPRLFTGFQPIQLRDASGASRVGIRVINVDGAWSPSDLAEFAGPIAAAVDGLNQARGLRIAGEWQDLRVQLTAVGNDWRTNSDGADYLHGLGAAGRPEISRALVDHYRPEVERRIRAALSRYAGGRAPVQVP